MRNNIRGEKMEEENQLNAIKPKAQLSDRTPKVYVSFSPAPRGYEVTVKYSFANGAEAHAAYEALREEAKENEN
jgi:hypothetical protein